MTKKKKVLLAVLLVVAAANFYIIFHHNPLADPTQEVIKKIISCCLFDAAYLGFAYAYDRIVQLPQELWQNRELIWRLAKNDFRSKYAGSYLCLL